MRKSACWLSVAALLSCTVFAQDAGRKFEAFEGMNPEADGASPVFQFSSAAATSDDPVIITVKGRNATAADRQQHRTAVQRYWLAVNVPERYEGVQRYQATCFHERPHEYPSCDVYEFVDPKTKAQHSYYIDIGNWRYDEVKD